MTVHTLTVAALNLLVPACAPYPPIPPEDPCANPDKLVCATYKSEPEMTFCGYTAVDDAGEEHSTICPRQTFYIGADGGKHFMRP